MKNHQSYPQYSFDLCLDLAERVYTFGGVVHSEELSRSMGRTNSGAFRVLINAAVKHGLLAYKDYTVYLTAVGKDTVANEDSDKRHELQVKAFLLPPVYAQVAKDWNEEINESNLEQHLVAMGVDKPQVVKRNFLAGAKELGIIQATAIRDVKYPQNPLFSPAVREQVEIKEDVVEAEKALPESLLVPTDAEGQQKSESQNEPSYSTMNPNPAEKSVPAPLPVVKVQTLLTGSRVAELSVPGGLSNKDFEILRAWLDVLKMSISDTN